MIQPSSPAPPGFAVGSDHRGNAPAQAGSVCEFTPLEAIFSTLQGFPHLISTSFSGDAFAERIRECVLELLIARGPGRTICLSEAAQTLAVRIGFHWHDLMRPVRTIAATLTDSGVIEALQQEQVVDIRVARGPIRLRLRALPGQRSAQTG